jgi:hypothetical protein
MKECDNSKIHTSSNFLLSKCLLIMLDDLFLRPSLHCNTSQHFTTLHYTYRLFTSSDLHFTTLSFGLTLYDFLLYIPWWWLTRTAQTCSFLDYRSKVLCLGWLLYCILYWHNRGDTHWYVRKSAVFRSVNCQLVAIVSGQPIDPIFKGQAGFWPLKMGSTVCPEMSVTTY